jgi:hypothetical protein
MLWAKLENPMLGLYAAMLHLRHSRLNVGVMQMVFENLWQLIGPEPDVLALGWGLVTRARAEKTSVDLDQVRARLEQAGPVTTPPMLRASWNRLVEASFANPGLIPLGSFSAAIAPRVLRSGPWSIWSATPSEIASSPTPTGLAPDAAQIRGRMLFAPNHEIDASLQALDDFAGTLHQDGRPLFFRHGADDGDGPVITDDIDLPMPGQDAPRDTLAAVQQALDAIARTLSGDPGLAGPLLDLEQLTEVERLVARAAFPATDPLLAAIMDKDRELASRLLNSERPSAADVASVLRLPAATLHQAMLSLQARVDNWREPEPERLYAYG